MKKLESSTFAHASGKGDVKVGGLVPRPIISHIVKVIPHLEQRYRTMGDYIREADGTVTISVSHTGNPDVNFIVSLHEMIEEYLTHKRGIPEPVIFRFDIDHPELDDPGMDPRAPYHREHFFCDIIDRLLCEQLGITYEFYQEVEPL